MRAVEVAGPYDFEIGASENVGGGALDAPCSIFPFPHRLSANKVVRSVRTANGSPYIAYCD